jgi:hypothetical protein
MNATPFRPFTVHAADGRRFQVPEREFLSHTPGGRTLIIYDHEDDEAFSIIDLFLVTEIEVPRPRRR